MSMFNLTMMKIIFVMYVSAGKPKFVTPDYGFPCACDCLFHLSVVYFHL